MPQLLCRSCITTSVALCAFLFVALAGTALATPRDDTRDQLATVLATGGSRSDVNATFRQSTKNPYNFVASIDSGLTNSDSLEVVVSATASNTIGFRVYPHYRGGYINVRRAKDSAGLMRQLLWFSDQNFLYWGADDQGDVFSGYTITLESGFPPEAIIIVLRSIRNIDKFVGELRPFLGSPKK